MGQWGNEEPLKDCSDAHVDIGPWRMAVGNGKAFDRVPYNGLLVSPGKLFAVANVMVMPAWALLALLPSWKWTRVVAAYITPSVLAVAWILLMAGQSTPIGGGFGSLEELLELARNPYILAGVWIHNLMLDLFLGAWQVRDAQRLGVSHGYVIPCLIATFLAGPVGLLAYFAVRIWVVRRLPT